jgi:phenylacetate-CoA ligase
MTKQDLHLNEIGSREYAQSTFERMVAGSKAYRDYLNSLGLGHAFWNELPLLTKKNFYSAYPWQALIPHESYSDIYSVIRSSGTTSGQAASRGFFWPQLKSQDAQALLPLRKIVTDTFKLHERRTLVIIGLSLGSWAGGEQFSFFFKSLALMGQLPLVLFSPGNQHREILEIIEGTHEAFDQILIALCPSAIFYLERLAETSGMSLPLEKISFLVTGEPFPESLREDLICRSKKRPEQIMMLSVYGSADTGLLGFESLPLIQLRQLLARNPQGAKAFGLLSRSVPSLFHIHAQDVYLEAVQGELVVTRWQGLPLVRYNLEDQVQMFSWKQSCLLAAEVDSDRATLWAEWSQLPLPDFIGIYGRTQGCVFLCGSNIFETMLQEAFNRSRLKEISSGNFIAWTEVQKSQQLLCWQIELKPGVKAPELKKLDELHAELVALVSEQQPEFGEDYEKFYKPFEKDGLRIFRFHFTEAPGLSEHPKLKSMIKRKILVENGPI